MIRESIINTTHKIFKVAQASTCGQCGLVYDPKGLFPSICAGCHGYCLGYVIVKEKENKDDNQ